MSDGIGDGDGSQGKTVIKSALADGSDRLTVQRVGDDNLGISAAVRGNFDRPVIEQGIGLVAAVERMLHFPRIIHIVVPIVVIVRFRQRGRTREEQGENQQEG